MGKRVLVIDDDLVVRTLIEEFLLASGQTVFAGVLGADCLPLIRSGHPDIVLLDYQLPDQSGLEVLKAIRNSPDIFSTRVILLSANTDTQRSAEQQNLRADWYLTKPFDFKELAEILNSL